MVLKLLSVEDKDKDELSVILYENDIDVIGLSETKLDAEVEDREVFIEGNRIFRNDRNLNGGGGGGGGAFWERDSTRGPGQIEM